jgi:hypothetical protein
MKSKTELRVRQAFSPMQVGVEEVNAFAVLGLMLR